MSNVRKVFVVAVLAVLAWAVAPPAEAQAPIRIGASVSKTGEYAVLGQNQLRGYQLCVKHTNEKGGVLGRKLELVVEDDQSQPVTAIRIYERLITQEKVDLVLGPFSSRIVEPVANVTEKYRMLMVAPAGAATSIFKKALRRNLWVGTAQSLSCGLCRAGSQPLENRVFHRSHSSGDGLWTHKRNEDGNICPSSRA